MRMGGTAEKVVADRTSSGVGQVGEPYLVDLMRGRDGSRAETAFSVVVRRYRPSLVRFAASIVGAGDAEDVVQKAFLNAFATLRDGGVDEIQLRPWLYQITRNAAIDHLRERGRKMPMVDIAAAAVAGQVAEAHRDFEDREEFRARIGDLKSLPYHQRVAITARFLEDASFEEIARRLGIPSGGAARQALSRARSSLRNRLPLLLPPGLLERLSNRLGQLQQSIAEVAPISAPQIATAATVVVASSLVVTQLGSGGGLGGDSAGARLAPGSSATGSASLLATAHAPGRGAAARDSADFVRAGSAAGEGGSHSALAQPDGSGEGSGAQPVGDASAPIGNIGSEGPGSGGSAGGSGSGGAPPFSPPSAPSMGAPQAPDLDRPTAPDPPPPPAVPPLPDASAPPAVEPTDVQGALPQAGIELPDAELPDAPLGVRGVAIETG